MKRGLKKKIAEEAGVNYNYVIQYFKGNKNPKEEIQQKITNAYNKIVKSEIEVNKMKDVKKHAHYLNKNKDRWDIVNNLEWGDKKFIAEKLGISQMQVHRVLEGKVEDKHKVIETAELVAAINLWKSRFCKYESKLNIEDIEIRGTCPF
ncbi:MAG: helix-turn-helix domain-containing protein [bacterium]